MKGALLLLASLSVTKKTNLSHVRHIVKVRLLSSVCCHYTVCCVSLLDCLCFHCICIYIYMNLHGVHMPYLSHVFHAIPTQLQLAQNIFTSTGTLRDYRCTNIRVLVTARIFLAIRYNKDAAEKESCRWETGLSCKKE